jgi:hypothetical protein
MAGHLGNRCTQTPAVCGKAQDCDRYSGSRGKRFDPLPDALSLISLGHFSGTDWRGCQIRLLVDQDFGLHAWLRNLYQKYHQRSNR